MPIPESEELLMLPEAITYFPQQLRPASVTVWRWCTQGYRGVYLESTRIGSKLATSREAIHRFIVAMEQADRQRRVQQRVERKKATREFVATGPMERPERIPKCVRQTTAVLADQILDAIN